jgi:hypothetical protein
VPPFAVPGFRGGPPIIDSSTCTGSGTFAPPVGRLRDPPLGIGEEPRKFVVEAFGDMSGVSEEDRGASPGRSGCAGAG